MGTNAAPPLARGYTPRDLARLLRVSPDKVRRWVAADELPAVNVGTRLRPCLVVTPDQLAAFLAGRRAAAPAPSPRQRRKRTDFVDFYP